MLAEQKPIVKWEDGDAKIRRKPLNSSHDSFDFHPLNNSLLSNTENF